MIETIKEKNLHQTVGMGGRENAAKRTKDP